ncbi:methyltransferase domain-containing protein [Changchengzhania lutea]|uniref:methyltransferase domain-containing protein n=1 Tax=Changchengzhania lutea TaxID=2049305 RepID=UPI00115EC839|nr:methyltransferase domain-containing protein [Changchengzhania lutea]
MTKFVALYSALKTKSFKQVVLFIVNKLFPYKEESIKISEIYLSHFKNKCGIEIGGPSNIFSIKIPLYSVVKTLDGCNFSNKTIWEGNIIEGDNYIYFKNKSGKQYICEANNLSMIKNEKYDFLIASHCLEHCANTLKTIEEWLRVVKKGGAILLILPDKKYTFDNKRPITTFKHLTEDYNNNIDETDLSHLTGVLELHDLNLDKAAGTKEAFKKRSLDNFNNRCLHHHVFDFKLLEDVFTYFNIKILDLTFKKPHHQIILGVKQ